jgi:cell division septation protein DedD
MMVDMSDVARASAGHPLPITRNHLYALGALSLSLAVLSFLVGLQVGRGNGAPAAAPPPPGLITEEIRSGTLEVLLARVEQAHAAESALRFPEELPQSEPRVTGPDPAVLAGEVPAEPVAPPVPTLDLPAEARPGSAAVDGVAAVEPTVEELPAGGWAVQVGEYSTEADAVRNVETLKAAGLAAYRIVALVGGETRWRVRIGGFDSKASATANAGAVGAQAGATEPVVVPAP